MASRTSRWPRPAGGILRYQVTARGRLVPIRFNYETPCFYWLDYLPGTFLPGGKLAKQSPHYKLFDSLKEAEMHQESMQWAK